MLESRTDVTADRKSGIVTIAVSDHSAERAAALAHEYVAALNHVVLTQNTSSAHKEREFLELRIGQVQQDLEKAERISVILLARTPLLMSRNKGRR